MRLALVHHRWLPNDFAREILADQEAALDSALDSGLKCNIHITEDKSGLFEYPGIRAVWDVAQHHDVVGYFHTKGVSHPDNRAVQDWRKYMEHFLFQGPSDKVLQNRADTCGVNFHTTPWPHYSGNFWWARSDYIRTCLEPQPSKDRMVWEKWIGTGRNHRPDNLHESHVNHYERRYP